jgi:hypothetical protein
MNCKCMSCRIYISLKQKIKEEKKDLQRLLLMVSEQMHIHEFNNHQSFCIFQIHVYGSLVHIQVHNIFFFLVWLNKFMAFTDIYNPSA